MASLRTSAPKHGTPRQSPSPLAQSTRRRQELVRDRRRRHRHVQLPPQLQCQVHVLLHHVDVEPCFFLVLQNKRPAILHHRRGNHAVRQHVYCDFSRNPALFRQQHSLGKRQHLHREAQVRPDLHHQRQAVVPDVCHFWPDVLQKRLHFFESFLASSHHHR